MIAAVLLGEAVLLWKAIGDLHGATAALNAQHAAPGPLLPAQAPPRACPARHRPTAPPRPGPPRPGPRRTEPPRPAPRTSTR
ncbi:hypothetical protein KCH_59480 [Kitasatospora cheerisanensis KCTC 2395]|uniref:Uncharacterized protein n=1 Tax=Kitasatospora cheerisanensis KCTC 2395 TaxID=1348663 RepID=A0A066YQJ2_9ACTN|nr:hypothetical protein KCH_59480 [Kitasatospora cheerisanensis KCTC 2395]